MSLRETEQRVQEAERQLSRHQQRVSRPGATLEDEVDYQRARARLALAERDLERAARQAERRAFMARDRARARPEGDGGAKRRKTRLTIKDQARADAEALFNLPKKEPVK
jgi:hypothetical protein